VSYKALGNTVLAVCLHKSRTQVFISALVSCSGKTWKLITSSDIPVRCRQCCCTQGSFSLTV